MQKKMLPYQRRQNKIIQFAIGQNQPNFSFQKEYLKAILFTKQLHFYLKYFLKYKVPVFGTCH